MNLVCEHIQVLMKQMKIEMDQPLVRLLELQEINMQRRLSPELETIWQNPDPTQTPPQIIILIEKNEGGRGAVLKEKEEEEREDKS